MQRGDIILLQHEQARNPFKKEQGRIELFVFQLSKLLIKLNQLFPGIQHTLGEGSNLENQLRASLAEPLKEANP
jgi:hypothetical protein